LLSGYATAEQNKITFDIQSESYANAVAREDMQALSEHFLDTSVFLLQAFPSIHTKPHIQQYFTRLFEQNLVTSFSRDPIEVVNMGQKQAEAGQFILDFIDSSGNARRIKGSYLTIWRSFPSSNAKIEVDLWNFDTAVDFKHTFVFDDIPSTVTAYEPHLPISSDASIEIAAYSALIKESVLLRDGHVLSNLYSKDGLIIPNHNPPIKGHDAISTYWNEHILEIPSLEGLQQRTTKLEDLGQYVIQHSSHIVVWRAGQYSGVNTGKHIRIWQRQPSGRLKIRILASAYDM
jgi:ketosteroid isomerase-like protein